jgi:TM2 domain-containing membrane protein YozV
VALLHVWNKLRLGNILIICFSMCLILGYCLCLIMILLNKEVIFILSVGVPKAVQDLRDITRKVNAILIATP